MKIKRKTYKHETLEHRRTFQRLYSRLLNSFPLPSSSLLLHQPTALDDNPPSPLPPFTSSYPHITSSVLLLIPLPTLPSTETTYRADSSLQNNIALRSSLRLSRNPLLDAYIPYLQIALPPHPPPKGIYHCLRTLFPIRPSLRLDKYPRNLKRKKERIPRIPPRKLSHFES